MQECATRKGEKSMIIIGIAGAACAFILWCCIKVGKESDSRLENLWEDRKTDMTPEDVDRKEEG